MIAVPPHPAKLNGLAYIDRAESQPDLRKIDDMVTMLDERFGRNETEKSRAWLNEFANFSLKTGGNMKDSWGRFGRTTTRLADLKAKLSDRAVFRKAIQALHLPEAQLPVVLSALEPRGDAYDILTLEQMTIRMYESHRSSPDTTDVYRTHDRANGVTPPNSAQ